MALLGIRPKRPTVVPLQHLLAVALRSLNRKRPHLVEHQLTAERERSAKTEAQLAAIEADMLNDPVNVAPGSSNEAILLEEIRQARRSLNGVKITLSPLRQPLRQTRRRLRRVVSGGGGARKAVADD